jgi:hypothetical protein
MRRIWHVSTLGLTCMVGCTGLPQSNVEHRQVTAALVLREGTFGADGPKANHSQPFDYDAAVMLCRVASNLGIELIGSWNTATTPTTWPGTTCSTRVATATTPVVDVSIFMPPSSIPVHDYGIPENTPVTVSLDVRQPPVLGSIARASRTVIAKRGYNQAVIEAGQLALQDLQTQPMVAALAAVDLPSTQAAVIQAKSDSMKAHEFGPKLRVVNATLVVTGLESRDVRRGDLYYVFATGSRSAVPVGVVQLVGLYPDVATSYWFCSPRQPVPVSSDGLALAKVNEPATTSLGRCFGVFEAGVSDEWSDTSDVVDIGLRIGSADGVAAGDRYQVFGVPEMSRSEVVREFNIIAECAIRPEGLEPVRSVCRVDLGFSGTHFKKADFLRGGVVHAVSW